MLANKRLQGLQDWPWMLAPSRFLELNEGIVPTSQLTKTWEWPILHESCLPTTMWQGLRQLYSWGRDVFLFLKKHLLKNIMAENRADCTPLSSTKVNPMNGNWDGTRNVVA